MKITDKYVLFWGDGLGNWTRLKKPIVYSEFIDQSPDGKYPFVVRHFITSEHMFMYLKAKYFKDYETAEKIATLAKDAKAAKKLGREVKNFSEPEWEKVREKAMFTAVCAKAEQDDEFRDLLLNPSWENLNFVEASPYDKIWGIGLEETDPRAADSTQWLGQNLLGKCMDEARRWFKFLEFLSTFEEHTFIEDLIWCPSQIEYYFTDQETGKMYVVYMRWRWDDPWTIELIETNKSDPKGWDFDDSCGKIDLGFYKDSEYEKLEKDLLDYLRIRFPKTTFPDNTIRKNIDCWDGMKKVDSRFSLS